MEAHSLLNSSNGFIYRSYCDFAISSLDCTLYFITEELSIVPERFYKKGEQSISEHSGSVITKPRHVWAISSPPVESAEENISIHLDYFRTLFLPKMHLLRMYKEDNRMDVIFTIWIQTNNAGIGLELNEADISFIQQISNTTRFTLLSAGKH